MFAKFIALATLASWGCNLGVPLTRRLCRHTEFFLEITDSRSTRSNLCIHVKICFKIVKLRHADL